MPCTTLLVGKKASYDGSTLMARNEDSGAGKFTAKKFIVVHPDEQPRHYRSVISKVEIDLPDNPMRYTAMPGRGARTGHLGRGRHQRVQRGHERNGDAHLQSPGFGG